MAAMQPPGIRGLGHSPYFSYADIAYIRLLLQLAADAPGDPAGRLATFLTHLEGQLEGRGPLARAQVWASLFILPPPDQAPRLEQRIPLALRVPG